MTNAQKFQETFGIYATEMWAMPEHDFLKWLNADTPQNEPSIDIVRCKECKWKDTFKCWMRNTQVPRYPSADDFCSYGERKESE